MSVLKKNQPNKLALFSALTAVLVMISGCQSLKTANATNQPIGTVQGQKPEQPVVQFLHHQGGIAGHESAQLGPDHQHCIRPWAGGFAIQVGLCGGKTRCGGVDQDRRAGSG